MLNANNIDEEWKKFISVGYDNDNDSDDDNDYFDYENKKNINQEFISANLIENFNANNIEKHIPKSSEIYISTKTKIAYLNKPIDLKRMFWIIPVIKYMEPKNGVIKKQMKFNSNTEEEILDIKERLKDSCYYDEQIITSINNPTGRIKFKDIRKITIGLSKKDIMSYRSKKKSAFYNCFVLILRIKIDNIFKEFHVKVFNTGKLEIPGIQTEQSFDMILKLVLDTLQPYTSEPLCYKENTCETVLINSNFNCGFYINREVLFDILKFKYNIQCIYDPCSYPGIQSKFYYHEGLEEQTGCPLINTTVSDNSNPPEKKTKEQKQQIKNETKINKGVEVSFMIFRTGSILIVGMCNETVLYTIYEFLKNLLTKEFYKINQKIITKNDKMLKDKKKKIRRKNIQITI
jgi:hypothetical protein